VDWDGEGELYSVFQVFLSVVMCRVHVVIRGEHVLSHYCGMSWKA
jgi:hypothetical protein